MDFDIRKFDEYREDNRREVKKASGGLPLSLWETYSAFANCNGGVILLGVTEKKDGSWSTTGLKKKDQRKLLKDFWDTVNNPKKVNLNLLKEDDVTAYDVNDDVVIVIRVPRADRNLRPVYINDDLMGGTFRRNWEGDYHCSKSEIRAMLRDEPEETMDMLVLEDYDLSDLSMETVRGYRNYHASVNPGHVWEQLPDDEYLEMIGAAGKLKKTGELRLTAAGLLMFGKEYRIVTYFPEYFLDYREMLDPSIRWTDRIQTSTGEWSGNVFDFFFMAYNKLSRDLPKPFALDGVFRVDDTPVHKAVREALANCLVNTDFYLPRGVVILKDREKIVMQNPGSIRTGKSQMLHGGISDPRNKAMMKMLNLLRIGEHAGSGVPDIYAAWEDKGWQAPMIEEEYNPDRTILTLPMVKNKRTKQANKTSEQNKRTKQANKTGEHKANILAYLQEQQPAGASDISAVLGLSDSRTRAILKELTEEGVILAEGKTNTRVYRIK